jgi:hypothetical protein
MLGKMKKAVMRKAIKMQLKKAGKAMTDEQIDKFIDMASDKKNAEVLKKNEALMKEFEAKIKEKTSKGMNQMAATQQVLRENPHYQKAFQEMNQMMGGMMGMM